MPSYLTPYRLSLPPPSRRGSRRARSGPSATVLVATLVLATLAAILVAALVAAAPAPLARVVVAVLAVSAAVHVARRRRPPRRGRLPGGWGLLGAAGVGSAVPAFLDPV